MPSEQRIQKRIRSAADLHPIAEYIIMRGLKPSELPRIATLHRGKTFSDLVAAWRRPAAVGNGIAPASMEHLVAARALALFQANVIDVSHLPDDGF